MHRLPFPIVVGLGLLVFTVTYRTGAPGESSPVRGVVRSADAAETFAAPGVGGAPAEDVRSAEARRDAFVRLTLTAPGPTADECRKGLADADVRIRSLAAGWLADHEVAGRVALLCEALRDRGMDAGVRSLAAAALVRIGSEECLPILIEYLEDGDPYVRLYAIQILESMTGDSLGFQPYSPTRARVAKAEEWRRWWAARTAK